MHPHLSFFTLRPSRSPSPCHHFHISMKTALYRVGECMKHGNFDTLGRIQILQISPWFLFPSLLCFVFLSLSVSQRRPLFLTEFQFGGNWKQVWLSVFISGGAGLFLFSRPVTFCGARSSCSTSLSHVVQCLGWGWHSLSLSCFFSRVTHSLPLFTSSISQVVTLSENHSPL